MTDIRKVEEGLGALFHELNGSESSVEGFEDITGGWETQIIVFTLTQPGGETLDLVARIYPGPRQGKKAESEFNVMHRLDAAGYPVPRVYAYETGCETLGSPFLIMERIRGSTLWDVFFCGPKEEYGNVLALNSLLMAQLHEIPPSKVLPRVKKIRTQRRVLEVVEKEEYELRQYGLYGAFSPLVDWLRANAAEITESPLCLIHRDFHPRNILLRGDGSPVVIDWAGCAIGDFREDLCWTALLAGTFIDESLTRSVYEAYGVASPRRLIELNYFEAFAGFRRLVDVAITVQAGATARGMRPEAIKEMESNRLHYAAVIKVVTSIIGTTLPELSHLLGV